MIIVNALRKIIVTTVNKMNKICCRNCGHESHCGIPLRKHLREVGTEYDQYKEIEVCKHCRCAKCTIPDWG